jgi:hypothetical protein
MKAAVVVPIFKNKLDGNETVSIQQCKIILGEFPIIFVAPESLCINNLSVAITPDHVVTFQDEYFKSVDTYSRLLLSKKFYEAFVEYEYILIYQLDAFVFNNELEYWCKQGYAYIGAPWFEGCKQRHEEGNLWCVGNGGFSLRNVKAFLAVFEKKGLIYSPMEIIGLFKNKYGRIGLNLLPGIIKRCVGVENTKQSFLKNYKGWEDTFWSLWADKYDKTFKVAPVEAGVKFSFECDPEYLFNYNNKKLPFGCNAWHKYDFAFWKPFIEQQGFVFNGTRS